MDPYCLWSHEISTVRDFFGTMAIMQEKQQKIVFEIEGLISPWASGTLADDVLSVLRQSKK